MFVRTGSPLVLVRLGGLRADVPASALRLTSAACDAAVLSAVARYLDVGPHTLSRAKVVRGAPGHLIVRWKSAMTRRLERASAPAAL